MQTDEFYDCNSEEHEMYDADKDDLAYFQQKKVVPQKGLVEGMANLSFLMNTLCPGYAPDPLLLGAVLDMVVKNNIG